MFLTAPRVLLRPYLWRSRFLPAPASTHSNRRRIAVGMSSPPATAQSHGASHRTCILPIGILEKHGPHMPMGSDLIAMRELAARATKKEYAVVFPDYFYGQINEAKHQPGAFALPERVVWDLLEATCDEIARNGFDKIVIINGMAAIPN